MSIRKLDGQCLVWLHALVMMPSTALAESLSENRTTADDFRTLQSRALDSAADDSWLRLSVLELNTYLAVHSDRDDRQDGAWAPSFAGRLVAVGYGLDAFAGLGVEVGVFEAMEAVPGHVAKLRTATFLPVYARFPLWIEKDSSLPSTMDLFAGGSLWSESARLLLEGCGRHASVACEDGADEPRTPNYVHAGVELRLSGRGLSITPKLSYLRTFGPNLQPEDSARISVGLGILDYTWVRVPDEFERALIRDDLHMWKAITQDSGRTATQRRIAAQRLCSLTPAADLSSSAQIFSRFADVPVCASRAEELEFLNAHTTAEILQALDRFPHSEHRFAAFRKLSAKLPAESLAAACEGDALRLEELLRRSKSLGLEISEANDDTGPTSQEETPENRWSPLHCAARSGHLKVLQVLVEAGVALDERAPRGETPLELAMKAGRWEMAESLIHAGSLATVSFSDGDTPLRYGIQAANPRLVQLLLRAGAPVNQLDRTQRTPLDYALALPSEEIARILLSQGGQPSDRKRAWEAANSDDLRMLFDPTGALAWAHADEVEEIRTLLARYPNAAFKTEALERIKQADAQLRKGIGSQVVPAIALMGDTVKKYLEYKNGRRIDWSKPLLVQFGKITQSYFESPMIRGFDFDQTVEAGIRVRKFQSISISHLRNTPRGTLDLKMQSIGPVSMRAPDMALSGPFWQVDGSLLVDARVIHQGRPIWCKLGGFSIHDSQESISLRSGTVCTVDQDDWRWSGEAWERLVASHRAQEAERRKAANLPSP